MSNVHTAANKPWRDYLTLCKPKVVLLMLITVWVGMFMAIQPGTFPWQPVLFGSIGIAAISGSGAAFNHWIEQRIDAAMKRTQRRPIASGRINETKALIFALSLFTTGALVLGLCVNITTLWLTVLSFIGYAFVYTIFLKPASPQNIVIGGIAGATPPLLGWAAITGSIDPRALLLVLIIFVWTPPHFWALAVAKRDEYALTKLPMLPVTHGIPYTKLQILLYAILLLPVSVFPYVFGLSGGIYLCLVLALDCWFISHTACLYRSDDVNLAMPLFRDSILYLLVLFLGLIVDRLYFFWLS
ncbi:MAG: heme o synthase [Pseudomonadota bacterium]